MIIRNSKNGKCHFCYLFVILHGLQARSLYEYSARYYMPDIPRFTTMDPLAEKKPWLSPYHYCSNNPINKIDPDGRFDGFPVPNTTYWQQAAVNYQKQEHIKANAPEIQRNVVAYTASLTDINDTVVLGTTITRGGDAINVDGTPASGVDIGFASLSAIIPAVSGSLVKGALKAVGEALGIVSDTKKAIGPIGDAGGIVMKQLPEAMQKQPKMDKVLFSKIPLILVVIMCVYKKEILIVQIRLSRILMLKKLEMGRL